MVFARTWTEELVAEWLQLEGFLVEVGVPAVSAAGGGRFTPDVVGARVRGGTVEVRHCEVSAGFFDNADRLGERYEKKFSQDIRKGVRRRFLDYFGLNPEEQVKYQAWVVSGAFSANAKRALEQRVGDLHLAKIDDFLRQHVLPSVEAWKERNPTRGGRQPTLPEGLWLLQMLDYLKASGLLRLSGVETGGGSA